MYLGSYPVAFNGHNRITLPKPIRQAIGLEPFVVLMQGDDCLWGFNKPEFEKEAAKRLEISLWEEAGRLGRRQFFATAAECQLDSHSRLIIPTDLVNLAELGSEMVLIGAGDHFEIWNGLNWSKMVKHLDK